ncbi:hypothetical protein BCR36DRAFT_404004 [Piromyces finnis]|uniref:Uncharacterized protein n=1 Tax=Piromyces finnis TaxID=1754191 RepID=A0A1Y1VB86_9FUNG|nr:hypothetical protein BCR36DRAFT_404004 [Piromyces finnis]|eukprot:ORX51764.1 hypothetical protein BCR36DRAFT_404004 [Piromyces finnis]
MANATLLNDKEYIENLRNISKLYITKKFDPAYDLCEKLIKNFEINNSENIFDKKEEEEMEEEYDEDFYSMKKKKEAKQQQQQQQEEKESIERSIIPSDLLQIYLKIIEQIKPEIDCWNTLNKYYKNVNEIPSKILTTCSLIEVKKGHLEASKKNLKKWLQEIPNEEKEKIREKQQPSFRYYEMLIEIYILHILAPLGEYNSSIDFLEGNDYLTMNRKKLICDKVIAMETMKEKEKQKAKNAKTEKVSSNKNLFSSDFPESTTSTLPDDNSNNTNRETGVKKQKQKRVNNKHQNKYDVGNAVIDGSYDPFWKIVSKFLVDKAPLLFIIILFIVIKKNPEIIRGTIIEKILKKFYETLMLIININ